MKHFKQLSPSSLFLITFTAGIFFSWIYPWHLSLFVDQEVLRLSGVVILLTSLILNILSHREFKKSHTPHAPFSTPKVLIQNGVFSFSRNPVYLALVLSQFGLGFVFDTIWLLMSTLILWTLLDYMVIPDEEKILESRFNVEYISYKQHTRRWF